MSAVSLDEAWGMDTFNSSSSGEPQKVGVLHTGMPSPPVHASHGLGGTRRNARRSARRSAHYVDDSDIDIVALLDSLQHVSVELKELRALFAKQQSEQKTVLYVAIGIIIVLLLFTAHSYSRLQYASECMLHWKR